MNRSMRHLVLSLAALCVSLVAHADLQTKKEGEAPPEWMKYTQPGDVHKAMSDVFGGRVFVTTISKSIRLEESPAHRESIFTFAPQSTGAYEYYKLCEEVIERV